MNKKWRIYPRGVAFWIAFSIIGLIIALLITAILTSNWNKDVVLNTIGVIIAFIIVITIIIAFLTSNISIDESNNLDMPFYCRNLMPFAGEKKKKIVLKQNLVDVHLMHTNVYVYLGYEEENGKVTLINVTMFSKKQREVLVSKFEEYKKT